MTSQSGLLDQSKAAISLKVGSPGKLTLSHVIVSLLAEEIKRKPNRRGNSGNNARALYTSKLNFGSKKQGKRPNTAFNRSTPGPSVKKKGNCNWCRIPGHYERECRKKMASEANRQAAPKTNLTTASTSSSKPTVLVSYKDVSIHKQQAWYLDNGQHTTCVIVRSCLKTYSGWISPRCSPYEMKVSAKLWAPEMLDYRLQLKTCCC